MRKIFASLIAVLAFLIAVVPAMAQDAAEEAVASGDAYVRVAHFSPDTPSVFVYNGENLVTSVRFPNVSRWVKLAPGDYTFVVTTEATPGEGAIEFAASLEAGQFVTVAAFGSSERGTLKLQAIAEDFSRITTGRARVTVVHAIEGAPVVDIRANGGVVIPTLAYPGSLGSNDGVETIEVPAGTYTLSVTASEFGTLILEAADTVLEANKNYFIAAVGTAQNPSVKVVVTDQAEVSAPAALGEGEARVRLAHLVPDGTPVTVFFNGEIRFSGLRYGSLTRFVPVQPGTYEVIVSTNSNPANAIIGPAKLTFENGSFTTIAATGTVAEGSIAPLVINEAYELAEGEAGVLVVHAIEDAPVVDVLVGEENNVLISGLGYPGTFLNPQGGFNDGFFFVNVPAGTYDLKVAPTGTTDAVLETTATFEAGKYYIVVASGSLGAGNARLLSSVADPNALDD